MNETYDFKVAWCKICNQGWVTIVKDVAGHQLTVMCAECENEWAHPLHARTSLNTKNGNEGNLVVDPTLEEIRKIGWDKYIISG